MGPLPHFVLGARVKFAALEPDADGITLPPNEDLRGFKAQIDIAPLMGARGDFQQLLGDGQPEPGRQPPEFLDKTIERNARKRPEETGKLALPFFEAIESADAFNRIVAQGFRG